MLPIWNVPEIMCCAELLMLLINICIQLCDQAIWSQGEQIITCKKCDSD